MNATQHGGTEIGDYAVVFGDGSGCNRPVVVAGQAVNVWGLIYLNRVPDQLARFRPFVSKDLDLAGNLELLERIRQVTGGAIRYSEPRTPMVGYVEILLRGELRKIEVLRDIKGLDARDLCDAVDVVINGVVARVLAPPKILKAKICNTVEIDQANRNDGRHVEIMTVSVREFIKDALFNASSGSATQRDVVNLLEEVRGIILSPMAARATALWGFDFTAVWPMAELTGCGMEKIERFARMRLDG